MVYVFYKEVSVNEGQIVTQFHEEIDLVKIQEIGMPYVTVESVPVPEKLEGKDAILYVELPSKQIKYRYVEREYTQQEQLEQLKQSQAEQDELIMHLLLGGM